MKSDLVPTDSQYPYVQLIEGKTNAQLAMAVVTVGDNQTYLAYENDLFLYQQATNTLQLIDKGQAADYGFIQQLYYDAATANVWVVRPNRLSIINTTSPLSANQTIALKNIVATRLFPLGKDWLISTMNQDLVIYNVENQQYTPLLLAKDDLAFTNSKVHFIKNQDALHFWIATDNGLYWASKTEGLLAHYEPNEQGANYLPVADIFHVSNAKMGDFWLATTSGLIHWMPPTIAKDATNIGVQRIVTTEQGLPNNELLAAYEDDDGFVWMPTPHGLIQWQIETGLSKTYQKEDGLSHGSFQEYAHTQAADGTLYFGGYQGFNVFHPKDFKAVNFRPENHIIITEYEQYASSSDKIENYLPEIIKNKSITLQPGDNF